MVSRVEAGELVGRSGPDRKGEYWGYTGYWCWEAAAIAKILHIDDSGLEGHEYYPYDLAHYFDERD